MLIEGFSSIRGTERLRILVEEIKKEFPGIEIVIPKYFERYGKIKQYFRKKTIPEYANIVRQYIIETTNSNEPIILIGYSMGAVIAIYLVERMDIPAKAVILVGCPLDGIKLSWWKRLLLKIVKIPSVENIRENSDFLELLNKNPSVFGWFRRDYYWLAGKYDKLVPLKSSISWNIMEYPMRDAGAENIGAEVFPVDHYALIPMTNNSIDINISAVPTIIRILRREIEE